MQKTPRNSVVDWETRAKVSDFLSREAELLDNGEYSEWLSLFSRDVHYTMPLRVTKEKASGRGIVSTMANFDEDYTSLEMRVLRFETEYAWSEDPPSRTRHVVSNVRVTEGENENELRVKSYFVLLRFRGDNTTFDVLSGERRDTIRRDEGKLMISNRLVLLDQTTLNTMNLAVFL